jgi:hypothetical protein
MTKNPNKTLYQNLYLSLLIVAVATAVVFIFFYHENHPLNNHFDIIIILMNTRYVALYAGAICLLLRVFRVLKNENLIYLLTGTINIGLGLLTVVQFYLGNVETPWFNKTLINLLIGVLIFADAFFLSVLKGTTDE